MTEGAADDRGKAGDVRLSLIVAVAENGVIGADGGMPWRVRADLRGFRALTMGKPMVMGRKSFEAIGRVLDGRDTIVVTRQAGFAPEGVFVAGSLEAGLRLAAERARARGVDEAFVAGGGEIYRQALPLVDRLYVTRIAARPEGDVTFPDIPDGDFVETQREPLPFTEGDSATAIRSIFERRR